MSDPQSQQLAAAELLARRKARAGLLAYIVYTSKSYVVSTFAEAVCAALDKFIEDVNVGRRPVLVLQAPPQHGKSEIVSRKLPAYLLGKFPNWRIAAASYASTLAYAMALDVRRNLISSAHRRLFPPISEKRKYTKDTNAEFTSPGGDGSYISDGVGGSFTGKSADIFIIDDPTKNSEEGLSVNVKEGHWNWFQSTSKTRMSANSGLIVMATSWAQDDLAGRIIHQMAGDPRLIHLRFPAINDPSEVGYTHSLPIGPLIPELHPLSQLLEFKAELSDYWWSALFQQSPKALGGNVFKEIGIQFYLPADLPVKFDKVINSWDCTFKDTDGTDFVVGQVWGKSGADCWLLAQVRDRMSFTETVKQVKFLRGKWPQTTVVLIEDKANGPAVIDTLKSTVAGILPVEPDGSKLARAHAVTSYWQAGNVHIPHPDIAPWIGSADMHHKADSFCGELTAFPAGAHDDQVDALTQALRHLYPLFSGLNIAADAIKRAAQRHLVR